MTFIEVEVRRWIFGKRPDLSTLHICALIDALKYLNSEYEDNGSNTIEEALDLRDDIIDEISNRLPTMT